MNNIETKKLYATSTTMVHTLQCQLCSHFSGIREVTPYIQPFPWVIILPESGGNVLATDKKFAEIFSLSIQLR